MKSFINFLPPWVETNIQPAFYDKESGSVLQQTARMYAKVNQLVRHFNCLAKETKETVDEYIAKFVELKEFVDTYFENLDVQEEINNKLDAMAEDGTLQEIVASYLQANAEWCFDTVADMQSAENLIAGSFAKTLGYHAINDGGGACYKITNSAKPADGGSVINIAGGLKAELTYNNIINVKQFGAYGDGQEDDTTAINNAIAYAKSIVIASDEIIEDEPVVQFAGRFKISGTIYMPPYLKYEMLGNVLMLCDMSENETAIKMSYETPLPTLVNSTYTAEQWLHGELIYGGALRLLSLNSGQGIGLELGNSTAPDNVHEAICRSVLRNVSIQGFDTALLINMFNFYIMKMENLKLHHNGTHVKFGSAVVSNENSGENISFVDCLFGTSTKSAIEQNVSSINVVFERCSFDFCGDGIAKLNRNISLMFNNCHIEGIVTDNAQGYIWIPSTSTGLGYTIKLNNCKIFQHNAIRPLIYVGNNATVSVTLFETYHNVTKETANGLDMLANQYMVDGVSGADIQVNAEGVTHNYVQIAKDSDLNSEGNFEDIAVDSSITTGSYYSVSAHSNYKGAGNSTIKEIDGKKYLEISPDDSPGSQNGNFLLTRAEFIPITPNRRYMASMGIRVGTLVDADGGFPNFQFNVYLEYYDENKTQIGSQQYYQGRNTDYAIDTVNVDYKGKRNVICVIPNDKRIKYAKVKYQYESKNNLSNLTHVYLTNLSFEPNFGE